MGEATSSATFDYVPTRSWTGNHLYMQASLFGSQSDARVADADSTAGGCH